MKINVFNKLIANLNLNDKTIIRVAGSVAVGKSTFAQELKDYLIRNNVSCRVECLSTDNFLYSNERIAKLSSMQFKGFPVSYNFSLLNQCLDAFLNNKSIPVIHEYSHAKYDIDYTKNIVIKNADIIILEGVIALHANCLIPRGLGVFLDANYTSLYSWYLQRFLALCRISKQTKVGYAVKFVDCTKAELINIAQTTWDSINWQNYQQHIVKTQVNADVVIAKNSDHSWNNVIWRDND